MSVAKNRNQWALLAKLEGSYGGGGVLAAASDGILVTEPPMVDLDYAHDGTRNGSWPGGNAKRVAKSGRYGTLPVATEFTGAGSAYSASAVPNIHALLRALGYSATLDATAAAEKYTYAPGTPGSLVLDAYAAGEKRTLKGVYGQSLAIAADGPVVPAVSAELMGFCDALPADASVPAVTYPNVQPPKATNITLSINAVTSLVVRSFNFSVEQPLTARLDENSGGHKGFAYGNQVARLEAVVEAVALSTLNPYNLADAQTAFATSLQIGSTQYNRLKLAASQAQLSEVEDQDDGPVALWSLVLELQASAPGLLDTHTLTAD